MSDRPAPLAHSHPEGVCDEVLRAEAQTYLARWPQLQIVADMLTAARDAAVDWWSPAETLRRWPVSTRMRWLAERPDVRQAITTALTGLTRSVARGRAPDYQAELIDAAISSGEVDLLSVERSFTAADLVVYGNVADTWEALLEQVPWEESSSQHHKLIATWLRLLMRDRPTSGGHGSGPFLTAHTVRSSIPSRVWYAHIPLDLRLAIDDARLRMEKQRPREPFRAHHELLIATPEVIAASIPLIELLPVFSEAGRALNVGTDTTALSPSDSIVPIRPSVVSVQTGRVSQTQPLLAANRTR